MPSSAIHCELCPRHCNLSLGDIGACGARMNKGGEVREIRTNFYASINVDPIEKKPLYHFFPGTSALSLGGFGCNLMCRGCQNASISRVCANKGSGFELSPDAIVDMALREGATSIAYTYNEPIVWWETMQNVARRAHEAGLKNVMVTAGYVSPSMRDEVFAHIDGVNIDLKGFSEDFYRSWARGDLATVCDTIEYLHAHRNIWFEVTTLVIPGQNDTPDMLRHEFQWLYDHIGDGVPLHLSAFFPHYHALEIESTPESTLEMARSSLRSGFARCLSGQCHGAMRYALSRMWANRHPTPRLSRRSLGTRRRQMPCLWCPSYRRISLIFDIRVLKVRGLAIVR